MSVPAAARTPVSARTRAAATTAALRLAAAVVGLVASVAISRALGPHGRGVYAVAVAIATVAFTVGTVSLHRALQYEWSRGPEPERLGRAALVAGGWGGVASALAAAAIIAAWPGPVPGWGIVGLALAAVPALVLSAHVTTLLVLHERPAAAAGAALLACAVQTVLLTAGAMAGVLTPTMVVAMWVLAGMLTLAFALRRLPRGTAGAGSTGGAALARTLLRRGARYHTGYLANHLLLRGDILLVAALRGTREAGLYSLAVAVTEPITLATTAVAQSGWAAQARGEGGDRYTAQLAGVALATGALLAVAAAVLAGPMVPLLFGAAFAPAVPALLARLPGVVALGMREPLDVALSRRDRAALSSSAAVAALLVNVPLNLLLIPRWGGVGAGVASSVAYAIQLAVIAGWFLRDAGLPAVALLPRAPAKKPLAQTREGP